MTDKRTMRAPAPVTTPDRIDGEVAHKATSPCLLGIGRESAAGLPPDIWHHQGTRPSRPRILAGMPILHVI